MPSQNYRYSTQHGADPLAITNAISSTPAIDVRDAVRGTMYIATGALATVLTFYGCEKKDGTYHPLWSGDPTPVAEAITVAQTKCYALPGSCFGCGFIKIVGTAGSGAKTATVIISLQG